MSIAVSCFWLFGWLRSKVEALKIVNPLIAICKSIPLDERLYMKQFKHPFALFGMG